MDICACRLQRIGNSEEPNILFTCGLSFSEDAFLRHKASEHICLPCPVDDFESPPGKGVSLANVLHHSENSHLIAGLFKAKCDVVFGLVGRNHIICLTEDRAGGTFPIDYQLFYKHLQD